MNNLTVVIPSRTLSNLRSCVEAINQFDSCRIIVVWDRSKSNTDTPPPELGCTVIPVDEDFIFARNANIGINAADPQDDIILMNDDALLRTPQGFHKMQAMAEANPIVGVIGAVTNVTGQPLQQPQRVGLREVPHFAFVCVLIPRRTILNIGTLDERYSIDYGCEDADYCQMVKTAGLRCAVYDHCFVDHASLVSTYRGDPHNSRSFEKNLVLFAKKWGFV